MKHCSVAALAIGTGLAAMAALVPTPAPAQSPSAAAETRRVPFGLPWFVKMVQSEVSAFIKSNS